MFEIKIERREECWALRLLFQSRCHGGHGNDSSPFAVLFQGLLSLSLSLSLSYMNSNKFPFRKLPHDRGGTPHSNFWPHIVSTVHRIALISITKLFRKKTKSERWDSPWNGREMALVAAPWTEKKRAAISLIASTRFLLFPLKEFGWKNIRQKFEQLAVSWRQTTRIFLHHFTCLTFEWSHFDDRY